MQSSDKLQPWAQKNANVASARSGGGHFAGVQSGQTHEFVQECTLPDVNFESCQTDKAVYTQVQEAQNA